MSLRNQVLHYADLDYDADEISRLLHVDRRLVLQIEAHRNDPEPATTTEGEQPTLIRHTHYTRQVAQRLQTKG